MSTSSEKKLEEEMIIALKEKGGIKNINMSEVLETFDSMTLRSLLSKSLPLKIVNNAIVVVNDDNSESIQIPDVSFDIDQDGNLRRSDEAESETNDSMMKYSII